MPLMLAWLEDDHRDRPCRLPAVLGVGRERRRRIARRAGPLPRASPGGPGPARRVAPISTSASGRAWRLRHQAGSRSSPAFEATTTRFGPVLEVVQPVPAWLPARPPDGVQEQRPQPPARAVRDRQPAARQPRRACHRWPRRPGTPSAAGSCREIRGATIAAMSAATTPPPHPGRSPACGSSTAPRSSPGRTARCSWATSAPTSSRSSRPRATPPAAGGRRGSATRRPGRGPPPTSSRSTGTSAASGSTCGARRGPRCCDGCCRAATSSSRTSGPAASPASGSTTPS